MTESTGHTAINMENSSNPTLPAAPSINRSLIPLERREWPKENRSSYTPSFISIGPLHFYVPGLMGLKIEYLCSLLKRRGNDRHGKLQGRFQKEARDMEQEARGYYALRNTISSDDFVDLLVLDGCFLIEFLLVCEEQNFTAIDQLGRNLPQIKRDILLLENQIPFFVLERFYGIFLQFKANDGTDDPYPKSMVELASNYLHNTELGDPKRNFWTYFKTGASLAAHDHHHLLHLYHNILFLEKHQPPISKLLNFWKQLKRIVSWLLRNVILVFVFIYQTLLEADIYPTRRLSSASEIEEAVVTFQGSCMDLRFEEGTLLVPGLTLNDQTFCLLRNLLAFEFYHKDLVLPYVNTYVAFLSDLIENSRDLEVMEKHHIITGRNDDKESIRLIRNLLEGGFQTSPEAFVPEEGFHWQHPRERRDALRKYSQEPHHRWWARLTDYFLNNPLAILGVFVSYIMYHFFYNNRSSIPLPKPHTN